MARITWLGSEPKDASDWEAVLRQFAVTMCPPKAKAWVTGDGAVEMAVDIRPSPGALSFGRRVREQQVYLASVCGTLTLRAADPADLHRQLERHYRVSTAQKLEDSGAA